MAACISNRVARSSFASSVVGNQATQSGGGAYVEAANATLEQFGGTFGGNLAIDGAGVFVQSGQFKQTGGVIYGNAASNWGGGLLIGGGGIIRTLARSDHQQQCAERGRWCVCGCRHR